MNIFNINSIVLYNDLRVPTNANGEMIGPMPDFKTKSTPTSQESRQIQLGLKFQF